MRLSKSDIEREMPMAAKPSVLAPRDAEVIHGEGSIRRMRRCPLRKEESTDSHLAIPDRTPKSDGPEAAISRKMRDRLESPATNQSELRNFNTEFEFCRGPLDRLRAAPSGWLTRRL
jgi:hypothetical protein